MKKITERRRSILDLMIKRDKIISTTQLMEIFEVTKPVIDEDLRVLKDAGYNIIGTPGHYGGYQLVDYVNSASMVLDEKSAKRYEEIMEKLPEEDRRLLAYVIHLAELGKIV